MRKRGLCCRPMSSVRLSVTFVYYIQTAEDNVKVPFRSGSHIILIFWPLVPVFNSKGNPFSEGVKYTGGGKICDFQLKPPFISETIRDRPIVATELAACFYGSVTPIIPCTPRGPGPSASLIFGVYAYTLSR